MRSEAALELSVARAPYGDGRPGVDGRPRSARGFLGAGPNDLSAHAQLLGAPQPAVKCHGELPHDEHRRTSVRRFRRSTVEAMAVRHDTETVQHEIFDLTTGYMQEVRALLMPVVEAVVAARSPEDFMRAQLDLRDLLAGRQAAMKEIKGRLSDDRSELGEIARLRPQPEQRVRHLQHHVDLRRQLLIREEALRHVHRCVADGLAWRAVSYDRAVFNVLGQGDRVGRFPDWQGLKPEFDRAQEIWDAGCVPLLNDMTNVLRTGDITVLHTCWPAPEVGVVEVKRSGRRRRGRQTELRERRLRLLDDGWLPAEGDRPEQAIWYSPVRYRQHLHTLGDLLAQARETGYAETRVDPAMLISAADPQRMGEADEQQAPWTERAVAAAGWRPGAGSTYQTSALAVRISERRDAGPASLAPTAAFPLPAEDITDLLLGALDYVVTVNFDELAAMFAEQAIDVEFLDEPKLFLRAARGDGTITVPAVVRDQMLRETMQSANLVELVASLLDGIDAGAPDLGWIVAMDESSSWTEPVPSPAD